MAAKRLPKEHPEKFGVFSVTGYDSESGCVSHVALLKEDVSLCFDVKVDVFHSGPPLQIGQLNLDTGRPVIGNIAAQLVGWIDDLKNDESVGIRAWMEEVKTRILPGRYANYRIDPPVHELKDVVTNRVINSQYSCIGFVMKCYDEGAGICLLDYNPASLPEVGQDLLGSVYGRAFELAMRDPERREKLGLPGDGPWRIMLAGYVFHALNRPSGDIRKSPHQVKSVDEAKFVIALNPNAQQPGHVEQHDKGQKHVPDQPGGIGER